MAKKKKTEKETTITDYYDLKTDKVDELVAALKGETAEDATPVSTNISEITGEEIKAKPGSKKANFDPYKVDKFSRIPAWVKAFFIKFWFAGFVCYFFMMGLGVYVSNTIDMMFIVGIVLGIFTDIMVNPIFRMLESDKKEYNNFMMFPFPFKAYWTFIANMVYYLGVIIIVNYFYLFLNGVLHLYFAVEPLLFGVIVLLADMALIGIKDGIVYGVKKAIAKKRALAEADAFEEEAPTPSPEEQPQVKSAEAELLDRVFAEMQEEKAQKGQEGSSPAQAAPAEVQVPDVGSDDKKD